MTEKRYKVVALGCRTNQYEGNAFANQLSQMGYVEANESEIADVCIVNTCTVTESADSHSRSAIRQVVRKNPNAKVYVTGCYAEGNPQQAASIKGVNAVIPNKEKEELLKHLFPEQELPEFSTSQVEARTRAFLKVQDGCNSFCTYCIIPYVRGRSRSRAIEDVIREAEGLIASGYREIVLTGINIGDFDGMDGQANLADLVRAIDPLTGLERLRISSIDPDEVDDNLLDAVIGGKRTCPSMHIVLQSGSNVILKRMRRKYTRQMFFDTCERLKSACPDFTFTTDIIVGFPGETEADFQETLAVMDEVRFAKVHMFPFSPRKRTRAALYPDQVPKEIARERKAELLALAERHAHELRDHYVGKTVEILTEQAEDGVACGHTQNFLYVKARADLPPNSLVHVQCKENTPEGLVGPICV